MMNPYQTITTKQTVQAAPIPGAVGQRQVQNNAGGYVFAVDKWERLRRFLILGSDGGTYYATEQQLTADNAQVVFDCVTEDGPRCVREIIDVSINGRAARQQPTLFALAIASAAEDQLTRQRAMDAVDRVCRTATHLFTYAGFVKQFRGLGSRGMKATLGGWYMDKPASTAAYQAVKYRSREGFTHRDMLRIAHPNPVDYMGAENGAEHAELFAWITHGTATTSASMRIIEGFEKAQVASSSAESARLVTDYGLPWETLNPDHLNEPEVWNALLDADALPYGAMVRQLPRLTRVGVAAPRQAQIVAKLTNPAMVTASRMHPLGVLNAMATYRAGVGRGGRDWNPVGPIIDALDDAFYMAFGNVEPAGKRTMLALDVSGSMGFHPCIGSAMTPREASVAMALVTAKTEPEYQFMGFTGGFVPLPITPRQRLDDAVRSVSDLPFERTDCAVPMLWAEWAKAEVDTFVIYTDNETWAGKMHPVQALQRYRQATGIAAKLVVVGMTATEFSIADPCDSGMLDVVGFDTAAPGLISAFSRGDI